MPFVRTPKGHIIVIANTDSWVMDSIAPVRKQLQRFAALQIHAHSSRLAQLTGILTVTM